MQIKLDFNINGSTARMEYLNKYLEGLDHERLTPDNLEMMSNYVLWGLQAEDSNLNFEIESKNSPWNKGKATTSLEALMEQEQETGMPIYVQMSDIQVANQKRKLDRQEVIEKLKPRDVQDWIRLIAYGMAQDTSKDCFAILATLQEGQGKEQAQEYLNSNQSAAATLYSQGWHSLVDSWFTLWSQIDKTEFMVQSWELEHGKRRIDLPIREELHIRLACDLVVRRSKMNLEEYEEQLRKYAHEWEGYQYLKKKRALVQMRTQQYSLLDCLQGETLMPHLNTAVYWSEEDRGLREFYPFCEPEFLIDGVREEHFKKEFYEKCVNKLAMLDKLEEQPNLREPYSIDFRNPDNVRQVILMYPELKEAALRASDVEGAILHNLIHYLSYYIEQCNFEPELMVILRAKMQKVSNKDIAARLKEEFNLDYKENYISTIFTKRIIEAIVEQVNLHYRLIEFITMGSTVFKRCSKCGKMLPRNTTYFNRRTSTSDGFFSSCKKCKTRRKN